jgi:predicted AAA+ superfamily ATPase
MAQIKRYLEEKILETLKNRQICIIYGARQTGKTTLAKKFLERYSNSVYLNGDFSNDQSRLNSVSREMVAQFQGVDFLVVDEAQSIPHIGMKLKVIHDTLPNIRILATGSSSFELANKVHEPLTGRNQSFIMYPIAYHEYLFDTADLEQVLLYGSYPGVVTLTSSEHKQTLVQEIAKNYLFKDVLNIEFIKSPKSLEKLLTILATQVGSEVSLSEISSTLELDIKTVEKYIDILEKLFIIFRLRPFSQKLKNTLTKKQKYYFCDLGIRNAVMENFSPILDRNDRGALWENFVILERIKYNAKDIFAPQYFFFRNYAGEEIDLVEVNNRMPTPYEIKWKPRQEVKLPPSWARAYPDTHLTVVDTKNYEDFIS